MKKIFTVSVMAVLLGSLVCLSLIDAQDEEVDASLQGKKVSMPFNVYTDHLARGNHYCPSGWGGDYGAIKVKVNWKENPHSGKTCIQWKYSGEATQGACWAGVFWQNPPNNWGRIPGGYDLSDATKLTFWARGEKGGEVVEFKAGGIMGDYPDTTEVTTGPITLTEYWKQYTIDFEEDDVFSYIAGGFCWVASQGEVPEEGITFYLDDIVYEKVEELEEETIEETEEKVE